MAHETAYDAWNRRWATAEGRADWLTPEPFVERALPLFRERGAQRALDLGCGVGRHTVYLAQQGISTAGVDASEEALTHTGAALTAAELPVDVHYALMSDLPFPDGAFDLVLSWNVIYHGSGEDVRRTLAEIRRVLRPGGLYLGTMLSKRNARFGEGDEVAPDTFVITGQDDDKAHAHFYCSQTELTRLLAGFALLTLDEAEHGKPGSYHWHLIAERR